MKLNKILTIAIAASLLYSCTNKEDEGVTPGVTITPNEEELITTVRLNFVDVSGKTTSFEFNDPDGDGGSAPTIDTVLLNKASVYQLRSEFLDASDPTDIEDITIEILEENDEHLICFATQNVTGVSVQRIDSDGTFEVGLISNITLDSAANSTNGTLRVTLKHQPGVKDGTCAPGDTDVEVDFPFQIK